MVGGSSKSEKNPDNILSRCTKNRKTEVENLVIPDHIFFQPCCSQYSITRVDIWIYYIENQFHEYF